MNKIDYVEDCIILQKLFLNKGWETTLIECQDIWEDVSSEFRVKWLIISELEERNIIQLINEFSKTVNLDL